MKLQDRLRKLETFAKVEPDEAISDALQRNADGERVFISI